MRKEMRDGILVVTPTKDLMGGEETSELRQIVQESLKVGHKQIVLNLEGISFVNSAGLGVLVAAHMATNTAGGKIVLAKMGERLRRLLQVTKLALVVENAESVEDAIKMLRGSQPTQP
jgi:anti-anti-sigma factor